MQLNSAVSLDSKYTPVSGSAPTGNTAPLSGRSGGDKSPSPRLVPSNLIETMRQAANNNTDSAKAHQWAKNNGYGTAVIISHHPIERSPGAGSTYVLSCYATEVVSNEFEDAKVLAENFDDNPDNTVQNWAQSKGYESGRLNGETDNNRIGIACIRNEVNNTNASSKLKEMKLVGSVALKG